ncbi:unnamed protein product [Pieris macdunnoughi]|uniref:Uncharacterized protein n=1 Tax=Pieris macdunnoughi TaxID=345717 RepID=A0A821XUM1_9NEOP|nr:unnamed protein product [Pieris macdunnoughi]
MLFLVGDVMSIMIVVVECGVVRRGQGEAPPPPGTSLARAFTLVRCAAAPQVTKFRELRDFYGCPKVDPEVAISGPTRPALILPGICNETLNQALGPP